jgi:inner membrane protein
MNEQRLAEQVEQKGIQAAVTARFQLKERFWEGRVAKGGLIFLLVLVLQIPIFFIDGVIGERNYRSHQATEEIASKWGREQKIVGPVLTVPYERKVEQEKDGKKIETLVVEYARFLAEELRIDARVESSLRHRGIFELPVYRVELSLNGWFQQPDFSLLGIEPSRILWDRASLSLLIADPRSITSQVALLWNEEKLEAQPLSRDLLDGSKGIEAPLKIVPDAGRHAFSCQLALQGSQGLYFAPMGRNTVTTMQANWPNPSFQGDWLPVEHAVDAKGFQATWQVALLGSKMPRQWIGNGHAAKTNGLETFGVNFHQPVDAYRMAERSVKYQLLFLTLTFATLWLMEVLTDLRLHPFHYLLVGAGMCLFYLLELSLAEQMGFALAYGVAALAVVGLLSSYCLAILKSRGRVAIIAGLIMLLYGYLYSLLVNQDYALLAGSIGLFLMLATVMFLTRKIDWFASRAVMPGPEMTAEMEG